MNNPLVSVAMITYNHQDFIERAINGVLNQETKYPIELIIGEDCSTDNTGYIVRKYQKKYPRIIRVIDSEDNVGMHKNTRRVEKECKGKYIALCEGDDFWHNNKKIENQVAFLENNPEFGLVHSDHDRYYFEPNKVIRSFFRTTGKIPPKDFNIFYGWGGGYNIQTCTVMVRKKLIDLITTDKYLYNSNRIGGGDIPRFIEISMKSKIHYINESLSTYTIQTNSASNIQNLFKRAIFNKSNLEAYLYLSIKYDKNTEKEFFLKRIRKKKLLIAFLSRNLELANEIKEKECFTLKSWLLYWGTRYVIMNKIMLPIYKKFRFFNEKRQKQKLIKIAVDPTA